YGDRYRLLRLGSCDFDFDVSFELLQSPHATNLQTVTEAVRDVFAGSVSEQLNIALHPPGGYSFFTPLPAALSEAERGARIDQEIDLLTRAPGGTTSLRVASDLVYEEKMGDGRDVSWYHVWAMHDTIHNRFEQIFQALPYPANRLRLSMQAAAAVIGNLDGRLGGRAPASGKPAYVLVIGWYGSHVEYTLCRDGRWYFSHYGTEHGPADSAYFAVTLLQRLGIAPGDVTGVFAYGRDVAHTDLSVFGAVFDLQPERLNPMQVVDLDPGSLSADFDAEAYVPCIGVAL
ncbi:MAG TPA: hypothetical protein VFG50_16685, partial [Rhodothermales bacterium]|nr:hypothetical protein [Rhodothermales bacterium]